MALYLWDSKLLTVNGDLAVNADCCCYCCKSGTMPDDILLTIPEGTCRAGAYTCTWSTGLDNCLWQYVDGNYIYEIYCLKGNQWEAYIYHLETIMCRWTCAFSEVPEDCTKAQTLARDPAYDFCDDPLDCAETVTITPQ